MILLVMNNFFIFKIRLDILEKFVYKYKNLVYNLKYIIDHNTIEGKLR